MRRAIARRVPQCGRGRDAVERDLMAARDKRLDETETPEEYDRRLKSDFLCYCNHDGLYADFHGLRHLFITRLERAGVSPKMAQTLARHSDIRLTLGIYTHLEVNDQAAAICSLPAPPGRTAEEASAFMAETGAYGRKDVTCKVPTVVPRGAQRCRKLCRTAHIAGVPACIDLHRNGRRAVRSPTRSLPP